jgi:hypothetical protein
MSVFGSGSDDMGGTIHEGMLSKAKVCAEYTANRNPRTGEIESKSVDFKGKLSLRIGGKDRKLSIKLHENLPGKVPFKHIFNYLMKSKTFRQHLKEAAYTTENLDTVDMIKDLKVKIGGRVTTVDNLWENYAKPLMSIQFLGVSGDLGDEDEDGEGSRTSVSKLDEYEEN